MRRFLSSLLYRLRPESKPVTLEEAWRVLCSQATSEQAAARIFDAAINLILRHHRSLFWGDRMLTLDKSVSFRDDPTFHKAIAAANSSTGTNQYSSPDGITWRFNTLVWAAQEALSVPGDFVECGVYEGDMSWVITEMVDLPAAGRRLHLFDTFAGFSEKYSSPADFPEAPEFFLRADKDFRRPEIHRHIQRRFASKPYVLVHRGVVPDTLGAAPESIAFLHLDMNSPEPERAALEGLFDRISAGGIIVFDDYGWKLHRLQKTAADTFMASRGHRILELPTGQGLAIKRR